MSLFRAISNYFREKKDDAAEAIGDVVRDAKYDIIDSETQIKEFESKIQGLMKANNNMKKQHQDAKDEYHKWEGLSIKAAKAGNKEDVEKCVQNKNNALREGTQLAEDIRQNNTIIANLRAQLNKARNKVAKAKVDNTVLSARLTSAKLRTNLAASVNALDGGPLSRLQIIQDAVRDAESDAQAWEELNANDSDLEDKYNSEDPDVDAEVEALMSKHA